jgi:hypothetical protein
MIAAAAETPDELYEAKLNQMDGLTADQFVKELGIKVRDYRVFLPLAGSASERYCLRRQTPQFKGSTGFEQPPCISVPPTFKQD